MIDENGRCSKCLQEYRFTTDGNGHLLEIHPDGPCVPPKQYEHGLFIQCAACDNYFDPTPVNGGPRRTVCGDICREARAKLAARNRESKRKLLREQAKAAGRTDQARVLWYNKPTGNPVGRPKKVLTDSAQLPMMGFG